MALKHVFILNILKMPKAIYQLYRLKLMTTINSSIQSTLALLRLPLWPMQYEGLTNDFHSFFIVIKSRRVPRRVFSEADSAEREETGQTEKKKDKRRGS